MLDDISRAKWNFITLFLSIVSFIILKKTSNNFVIEFGDKVKISNLFLDGYLSSTMQILGLIFTTIVLLIITIIIGIKLHSITSYIQSIVAFFLVIFTFSISLVPFIGTAILIIIIGGLIIFIANDN
ncbi:hypothetical protein [Staphylococcus gallinarum]|uniref:hypothetical protein n=1 Tax=Staphylococcus gallinarum TaxID=1293 RepID=UPI001E2F6253|nr:hypothetical protein [Staphylococcus gallinarum]MCD8920858.1 hypothetical protein [Staphylococcus gallinarum]UEH01121.1 hypothetical protein K3U27_01990 [Staphylococcus gallinarum]